MPVFSAGGAGAFAVTTNTPQTIVGAKNFTAGSASTVPLVVQGAASQTGNLTEWRNSTGTVLNSINASGTLVIPGTLFARASADATANGEVIHAFAPTAVVAPIIAQGAASQTANLQEWRNSGGTVLASVSAGGDLRGNSVQAQTGGNTFYLNNYNGAPLILSVAATNTGMVVRGAASQSGNLQEWQNSAGSVLANVSAAGGIRALDLSNPADNGPYFSFVSNAIVLNNRVTATNVPLIVKGMASQTGDLQEWQNSSGTVLVNVTATGYFSTVGGVFSQSGNATTTTIVAKAAPSQSANLQEWQNSSGGLLFGIRPNGRPQFSATNSSNPSINGPTYYGYTGYVSGWLEIEINGSLFKVPYYPA